MTVLLLIQRVEPVRLFSKIDWTLLLFFAGLFIVVAGFQTTGLPADAWAAATPFIGLDSWRGVAGFTALITIGSNVVSNVPLVLIAAPHLAGTSRADWVLLAFVSTLAGNLTLVGSVANLIVAEGAKEHYHLGFGEYLRFGVVSTACTLVVGVTVLLVVARALGG
jgi:Na+/H+ antiporter NhaD/arsenite permease-like protein